MDEGKLSLESKDIAAEKRQDLLRLFPEAQTEGGKIDFDQLKRALGENVDAGRERYGMTWPGKADCFRLIQSPSTATLLPVREESLRFDETDNIIIEGDNLEVLKLLQKGYQNKIKLIYIDPPYNTGNDFIYPDDFVDNLKNYLQYTGQADSEGKRFSDNLDSDGRFHSNWLNMMYPRLYLAKNLLREDGIIAISIDDHEIIALRSLCEAIFGENSIIGTIVWKRRQVSDNRNLNNFSTDHEYVLLASASAGVLTGEAKDLSKYDNPDDDPRGPWMSDNLTGLANAQQRPNLHYNLVHPETKHVYPPLPSRGWAYEPKRMKQLIGEGRILWPSKNDGRPRLKRFLGEIKSQFTGLSSIQEPGFTTDGTRELEALFGEKILEFPKPRNLISLLLTQVTTASDGDIVLDFFAGSGTTAHAVVDLNAQDSGNRSFVLVQLPEPTGRTDYKVISDITKERARRVIQRQERESEGKLDLQHEGKIRRKEGFRAFKLAPSNFKIWDSHTDGGVEGLERQMELAVNHIMPDRTAEDLFYEILMKSEYPLTAKVENFDAAGIAAFSVEDDALIVCVERKVTAESVTVIAKRSPSKVIFLDEAFSGNDQLKANAKMNFESAGVKRFETV